MTVDDLLNGSPYLVEQDGPSRDRLEKALAKSDAAKDRAVKTRERIAVEASELLEPYLNALRTDLVAESNLLEGIEWSAGAVREVVLANRELLDAPVGTLVDGVRGDPRVYEALGLYRAHLIAEEWAAADGPPRVHEIRELHRFILGASDAAGRYKRYRNAIGGSNHRTAETFDVQRVMLELADWWHSSVANPVLTATVIHAWLAHIHPFEDGNGRLARILANLELARSGYPPLVIRAGSDRGEYYTALAASDDGDILPLFELFEKVIRRQVRIMSRPSYVIDVINDRLLADEDQRRNLWLAATRTFANELSARLSEVGFGLDLQGLPSSDSFALLCARDHEGNGWFATIRDDRGKAQWLLWFGYRSIEMMDLSGDRPIFPSIFVSRRDESAGAPHPYTPNFDRHGPLESLPVEIAVVPGLHQPVGFRRGYNDEWLRFDEAAQRLAATLVSAH